MSDSGRKPIVFTRPDPTQFALLVTRAGRGTVTLVGTEHFKPTGCEWATDEDMRAAGYMTVREGQKLASLVREAAAAAKRADAGLSESAAKWVDQAEQILSAAISQG